MKPKDKEFFTNMLYTAIQATKKENSDLFQHIKDTFYTKDMVDEKFKILDTILLEVRGMEKRVKALEDMM